MAREELERLWRDERNWRGGAVYVCKEDPRIIVPKRTPWSGWTVNFAHPLGAWMTIALSVILAVSPTLIAFMGKRFGFESVGSDDYRLDFEGQQ